MQNGSQMRITDNDIAVIKGLFADNEEALKVLRKVFLPELDPEAPLGGLIDIYMATPTENQSEHEIAVNLKSRNMLIQHVDRQLIQLKALAGTKAESVEETKKRLTQNSAK